MVDDMRKAPMLKVVSSSSVADLSGRLVGDGRNSPAYDRAQIEDIIKRRSDCPLIEAMGANFTIQPDGWQFTQPLLPQVSDPSGTMIDRSAIMPLFDHAMGCAGGLTAHTPKMVTTLDYRVDWCRAPAPGRPVTIGRITSLEQGRTVVVTAAAFHSDEEEPIAIARGQFIPGILPGGMASRPALRSQWVRQDMASIGSFEEFMGIEFDGASAIVPGAHRLIGAVPVQAYHGGLIAAAMELSIRKNAPHLQDGNRPEIASITCQYLRPAIADRPLFIACKTFRAGRTSATLDVQVSQELAGPICARATAMLIAETG